MTADVVDSRQEQWARCGACDHTWHLCTLPMEMGKFGKLVKHAHCPACGQDSKRIFLFMSGRRA